MQSPRTRVVSLVVAIILMTLGAAVSNAQTTSKQLPSTGDSGSVEQIESIIKQYAQSIDTLDLDLARELWSNQSEVSFIHPRGTEYGLNDVLGNVYGRTMGTFSKRQLLPDKADIHVYNDTAWSEFTWTFHAIVKNGGQNITTQGRETQVYHKENGTWRIVHVHYSGMPVTGELKGF